MARHFDLIVIGAGPGGYTAAEKAAKFGMKVAIVEKEKIGGVCVNKGCIPTKALLHASSIFSTMQQCDTFGVSTDFISFDFAKMQNYKTKTVREYRKEVEEELSEAGVTIIKGTAKIRRNKTVEVVGEDGHDYYEADHIIIATGAKAKVPGIPGIHNPGVVTSGRLLASKNWNYDRLTIIGGGVIGVEFATIFNSLCSKVTIIEKKPHLLGPMDSIVAEELKKELISKGIQVYCNAEIEEITNEDGLVCHMKADGTSHKIKSSQILVATGRVPDVGELLGEDVSLEINKGRFVVDDDFMTSEKEIYAVGDVVADTQLAHVAAAQATYVVEKIAGREHRIKLNVVPNGMYAKLPVVPNCIYTNPEIATVGITEETARSYNMKVLCGHYAMTKNGKSIISKEENGFIRLIFDAYSYNIVGAQIVCARATDMIGEMATAIASGLSAHELLFAMRAHPTYSEGITAAIEDALQKTI